MNHLSYHLKTKFNHSECITLDKQSAVCLSMITNNESSLLIYKLLI